MKNLKKIGLTILLMLTTTGLSSCGYIKVIEDERQENMESICIVTLKGELINGDKSSDKQKCKFNYNGKQVTYNYNLVTTVMREINNAERKAKAK